MLDELAGVDLHGALLLAHAIRRAGRIALVVVDGLEVLQAAESATRQVSSR